MGAFGQASTAPECSEPAGRIHFANSPKAQVLTCRASCEDRGFRSVNQRGLAPICLQTGTICANSLSSHSTMLIHSLVTCWAYELDMGHLEGEHISVVTTLLQEAVNYSEASFEGSEEVSGAALVEWFSEWRVRAKQALNGLAVTAHSEAEASGHSV